MQALYDEDDPDCPYRKVRVAMPKLRRVSITISEFAKGVFIRVRRFRRDCTVSLLQNDFLLTTKHFNTCRGCYGLDIAILESFHQVASTQ